MNDREVSGYSPQPIQYTKEQENNDESPFQVNVNLDEENKESNQDSEALRLVRQQLELPEETKSDLFVSGGESLLSKMGGMLLAKALLPTGKHTKQALAYLDTTIKIELVLYELCSSIYWCSVLEIALMILGLLLFLSDTGEMIRVWMHVPHILRSMIGLKLVKLFPHSHQIAENVSIPQEDKVPFQEIMRLIVQGAQDALRAFTSQARKWIILYFIMTVVCLLIDVVSFFLQVAAFGSGDYSAFADMSLILLACAFMFFDWFYLLYIVSLGYKFPTYMSQALVRGLLGMFEAIHQRLGHSLHSSSQNYDIKIKEQLQRYSYADQPADNSINQQANQL